LQYVPKGQTAVLSRLKSLKLLMEQLSFGVGPSWQISEVVDAAGSLPLLETLALQFLKPSTEAELRSASYLQMHTSYTDSFIWGGSEG
jgi:hypothetical protein